MPVLVDFCELALLSLLPTTPTGPKNHLPFITLPLRPFLHPQSTPLSSPLTLSPLPAMPSISIANSSAPHIVQLATLTTAKIEKNRQTAGSLRALFSLSHFPSPSSERRVLAGAKRSAVELVDLNAATLEACLVEDDSDKPS